MTGEVRETTREASDILAHLDLVFQDADINPLVVEFGGLLADRLNNPEIVPMGFVMGSSLLIEDLKRGVSGYTNEPIDSVLANQPPEAYESLYAILPTLAEVSFSESFSGEVREHLLSMLDASQTGTALPEMEVDPAVVLSKPLQGMPRTEEEISSLLEPVSEASDEYEAVGRWWAHKVLDPEFNNGGTDEPNIMMKQMATMLAREQQPLVEGRIREFAVALADLLREREETSIYVDYHADPILMEAADIAGMEANDMLTFPIKTGTYIQDGIVTARAGYGSPAEQIWPPIDN